MSGVQAIERTFSVLRRLSAGAAGITEVATHVGLPKSTVSRLLSTLEGIEIVEQVTPGGPYRLGPGLLEIAATILPGRNIVGAARPHLVELMHSTGEATGLSVLDGFEVHYLDQIESENPVQVRDWTGQRIPAHVVPSGLVLLAAAPAGVVEEFLAEPLESFTAASVTAPAQIRRRLEEIATAGSCWLYEEYAEGINSVAVPVSDVGGQVIAAVHAHGPAYRFPGEQDPVEIAGQVAAAAKEIEVHLRGYRTAGGGR